MHSCRGLTLIGDAPKRLLASLMLASMLLGACGGSTGSPPSIQGNISARDYVADVCRTLHEWSKAVRLATKRAATITNDADPNDDKRAFIAYLTSVATATEGLEAQLRGLGVPNIRDGVAATNELLSPWDTSLAGERTLLTDAQSFPATPSAFKRALKRALAELATATEPARNAFGSFANDQRTDRSRAAGSLSVSKLGGNLSRVPSRTCRWGGEASKFKQTDHESAQAESGPAPMR